MKCYSGADEGQGGWNYMSIRSDWEVEGVTKVLACPARDDGHPSTWGQGRGQSREGQCESRVEGGQGKSKMSIRESPLLVQPAPGEGGPQILG